MRAWRWDLFCRVIDNFGDVGVCWRLAAALGARGHAVRLWIDDASALAWMAPQGAPGVTVQPWDNSPPDLPPGEVVVEAFGCAPPPGFVARMAAGTVTYAATQTATPTPPVWINLEYLSAEAYVERSHGLRSPQFAGPGARLDKWFFYPGFTPATGGLLQALARTPTTLLLPTGALRDRLQAEPLPSNLRLAALPRVSQPEFDRVLAATDLNLVRGEDSFVRAQLCAGAPFVWQIYPQHDGAHAPKLEAFLDRYLAVSPPALASTLRQLFHAANGLAPWPAALPEICAWQAVHQAWRARLRAQDDLCVQLLRFVKGRLG